jgi:N-methylhydantoinase A/oxoprolinase/acetone carboxylase beta subunit
LSIVGIDVGGTFTDLVRYQDGAIVTSKCSTVPAIPRSSTLGALQLGHEPSMHALQKLPEQKAEESQVGDFHRLSIRT